MADWLIWLIIAGVLGAAEVLTLTLVLGMLSVAAAVAAVVAGVGIPPAGQVGAFAAAAVLLLGVARPVATRHRQLPAPLRTGTAALLGSSGIAMSDIDSAGGQVRLGGEIWTARCYDEHRVIPAGARVHVIEIDGATAVVLPLEV
jgi:membrane protein implicated in regulation of membrane protease activity